MFKTNKITLCTRAVIAVGASSLLATTALAKDTKPTESLERIEITGSAIKQTDMEGALPVQVFTAADISKSGVSSAADLLQQLPAMQGFTTSADSVGGGGGGMTTASIHDIGESYTLVLLNGRRIAPSTSGSTVDLSAIPVAAIKNVQVLTDGASALYGSDAIAGVVNIILKDEIDGVQLSARTNKPQQSGGEYTSFSIATGFGDIDNDGFSLALTYSHEDQKQLAALDRDFAKTGIISFTNEGRDLYFFNGSGNAIAGNARVQYIDDDTGETTRLAFNPYAIKTGECAEYNSAIGYECWFDYTSTIEIVPENQRDSLFLNGKLRITDNIDGFFTGVVTKNVLTARIAPYPTGWFNLDLDSDLVQSEVMPYLPDELSTAEIASIDLVQARWRALPAGNRTTEYDTLTTHFVTGITGVTGDIDWSGALTYSKNKRDENYVDGWLLSEEFNEAVSSGSINVFVPADELDEASQAALEETIYRGEYESTTVSMVGLDFKGAMPVFDLPGGQAYLAVGADYRSYNYDHDISEASAQELILFYSAGTEYDFTRNLLGVFGELQLPITDSLTATTSVRYDNIGAVEDNLEGEDVNSSESDITYKLSARWEATDNLVVRGSYGTGFKAPSLLDIGSPRADYGVTSGSYSCPFDSSDELAQYCLTGKSQYSVYTQGNPNLKPEKSKQYTLGMVYSPSKEFSFTLDYWNVELSDAVSALTEAQIFEGAERYRDLFTTKVNTSTGEEELAILEASVNLGKAKYSGLDFNISATNDLGFGTLKTSWSATYMIESTYTSPGTTDEWVTSMGRFGENDAVTFRLVQQIQSTLTHGDFEHTLRMNYRSGYMDQLQTADDCYVTEGDAYGDCVQIQLHIPTYILFAYQTKYNITDDASVTFGINNLFDKEPPLSLRVSGAGHQVGYDPRYTDSYGRTFYLQGDYKF